MEMLALFVAREWPLFLVLLSLVALLIALEVRRGGVRLSPHELTGLVNREGALVLDVRPEKEFSAGHISNAVNIPYPQLDTRIAELKERRDKPVVVVCAAGQHAGGAVRKLQEAGFERVLRLGGGLMEWRYRQLPLVTPGRAKGRRKPTAKPA